MKRRQRFFAAVLVVLIALLALFVWAAWPGKSTFTMSAETTYVTDKVDKHGYVDYVTAVNERLSKGVTPDNNANVLIWKALGPHPEGTTMPPEYFQWLKIDSPPEQGEYMVDFGRHLQGHLRQDDPKRREALYERQSKAAKWPWSAKDEPELAAWLARNEKPLAVLIEATRQTEYYNPITPKRTEDWSPGLLSALLPSVQKCREFASALTCRAMLRLREGKIDEAWQDLLACHRLGRLVARGGCLIEALVGIAIDQVASTADLTFLSQAKLSAKQCTDCLNDLARLPPMPPVADKIDLTERCMLLETMLMTARHGLLIVDKLSNAGAGEAPTGNEFVNKLFTPNIDWDPALRNANRWCDLFVAAARKPDRSKRHAELWKLTQELKILKQGITASGMFGKVLQGPQARGEAIGNILITLMLPAVEKVLDAEDRREQVQRNLRIAFALAAFHADHGRYPAKLDDLAPKHLAKIPDDMFADKPLRYRPDGTGYLLYSVGVDGADDQGQGVDDDPRGDDLRIRMPVPEPKLKK